MKIYMVTGVGPNDLEIPLVPFFSREAAEKFISRFPKDPKYSRFLHEDFSNERAPYVGDDHEATEMGAELYNALFKDGYYYSGCGGVYELRIIEAEEGKPMVRWDLD